MIVAATQATLQREAEEQAMRATTDQVIADEATDDQVYNNETPNPLNISATQPPSLVDITQSSSIVLSQMLGEVRFLTLVFIGISCMPLIVSNLDPSLIF